MNSKNRKNIITIRSFEKETGIHFTINHTGKMEGMQSLSTSCICNPACIARMKDSDSICSHCFAAAMHKRYGNLAIRMEQNYQILSSRLFEVEELPMINAAWFRFESFGDLGNATQARNYLRIAKRNPQTFFAIWTKNPSFMEKAIEIEGKPENINIILSSPYMNTTCDESKWGFVDKTFTVFDKQHSEGVKINCGDRKCMECRICYTKNETRRINETLK